MYLDHNWIRHAILECIAWFCARLHQAPRAWRSSKKDKQLRTFEKYNGTKDREKIQIASCIHTSDERLCWEGSDWKGSKLKYVINSSLYRLVRLFFLLYVIPYQLKYIVLLFSYPLKMMVRLRHSSSSFCFLRMKYRKCSETRAIKAVPGVMQLLSKTLNTSTISPFSSALRRAISLIWEKRSKSALYKEKSLC